MVQKIKLAFMAGMLIAMGCVVNLKVGGLAGAVLFSAGLWYVCGHGAHLFTGRAWRDDITWPDKLIMLAVNVCAAGLTGLVMRLAMPELETAAWNVAQGLANAGAGALCVRAFMCGVCMYLAVTPTNDQARPLNIIYGVVLFMMSGYAHSIAIAGYVGAATDIGFIWIVPLCAVFNALGGYFMKWIKSAGKTGA